jgi:hypothetical protein
MHLGIEFLNALALWSPEFPGSSNETNVNNSIVSNNERASLLPNASFDGRLIAVLCCRKPIGKERTIASSPGCKILPPGIKDRPVRSCRR